MIDPEELCEQALYDPDDTELWDRAGYALGLHEPNYPMPAIPLAVRWYPIAKTDYATLCVIYHAFPDVAFKCYVAWWGDGTRD